MSPHVLDLKQASRLLYAAAAGIAVAAVALGWLGGVEFTRRVVPEGGELAPSTGAALVCLAASGLWRDRRTVSRALAALAGALALVNLLIAALSNLNGVDAALFGGDVGAAMSPATSACIVLTGLALIRPRLPGVPRSTSAELAATLTVVLSLIAVVAYLLDPGTLVSVFVFADMSLPTAIAILCLGLAVLIDEKGWIWLMAHGGTGGRMLRVYAPATLTGPTAAAAIILAAERAGFDPAFGLIVFAVLMTAAFFTLLVFVAAMQNRGESALESVISEREQALKDRSVLLSEVYHRVKNNLQQIDALLWIEARKHRNNPAAQDSFRAMSGRVHAVSLVHRQLLQRETVSNVDMADYLTRLGETVAAANGLAARDIRLSVEAESANASLSSATTIGLLVNEVVANSVKHAFPDGRAGEIGIAFRHCGDGMNGNGQGAYCLSLSDDGVGIAAEDRVPGTGTRVIEGLVRQLSGFVASENSRQAGGARIDVLFPAEKIEEYR